MEWQLLNEDGELIATWGYSPTISEVLITATANAMMIGTLVNKSGETILLNFEIT